MEASLLPREFGPRTIPALLRARAQQSPSALAVVAPVGGTERALTRQQLEEASDRMAWALRDRHGVAPDSHVAWLLSNDQGGEALITYHAVLKLGAVNVPLNTRLSPTEVAALIDHSGSEIVLVGPESRLTIDGAATRTACPAVPIESFELETIFADSPPPSSPQETAWPCISEDSLACILYTSGTTGLPKGVEHTHGSALAAGLAWCDAFSLTPEDIVQSPFPIYSGAGLHFNGLAALWGGAGFLVDTSDVAVTFDRVDRYHSTVYTAVPSIYLYWLESPDLSSTRLGSLRTIGYGGATMPTSTILELRKAFPKLSLIQTYGSTEAGPGGTYLPPEYAIARLGSIGNRVAGRFNRIRVVRDDGEEVGPGELGELLMAGASMMRGYYREPEATAAVVSNGWVRSGDLVRFDEDGFLYFVDRRRDIVVRGGLNISTFEVEEALLRHPGVSEAAVFGARHARLGEEVHAAVVLRPGVSLAPDELTRHCLGLIADFKVPSSISIRESLPRNASGKVLKRVLAEGG